MEAYQPRPEDISGVRLESEVLALVDKLARNVHEAWAARRLAEGWRYGERRDDAERRHPCLVPYEELTESERAYDRLTVEQTLQAAVKLGCEIHRCVKGVEA
jgi:hypothetical protein